MRFASVPTIPFRPAKPDPATETLPLVNHNKIWTLTIFDTRQNTIPLEKPGKTWTPTICAFHFVDAEPEPFWG
jgi:hypothetical protein